MTQNVNRATRWPTKGTFLVIFQTLCLKCCEERLLMALILQEALRETCCRALKMCASPWNAICLATKSLLGKWKFTHFENTLPLPTFVWQQHSSLMKIHSYIIVPEAIIKQRLMALGKVKGQRTSESISWQTYFRLQYNSETKIRQKLDTLTTQWLQTLLKVWSFKWMRHFPLC